MLVIAVQNGKTLLNHWDVPNIFLVAYSNPCASLCATTDSGFPDGEEGVGSLTYYLAKFLP